jgi:hypothetical protein
MLDGQVFELPMLGHLTTDSEFSSLPTPTAIQSRNATSGRKPDSKHHAGVTLHDLVFDGTLLPTPSTMEHLPARTGDAKERQLRRGGSSSRRNSSGNLREDILEIEPELLPTPQALEGFNGNNLTVAHREGQGRQVMLSNHAVDLAMLPTPLVDDAKNSGQNQTRRGTLASEVYGGNDSTNWGKFEPAIRRWEQIFGHPAPAPTKPDGKDGAHRLSAEFTEWMMGLVPGWITGADISRAEALKAAGNGVVPQQAELALRQLLQGIDLIPKNVAPSD